MEIHILQSEGFPTRGISVDGATILYWGSSRFSYSLKDMYSIVKPSCIYGLPYNFRWWGKWTCWRGLNSFGRGYYGSYCHVNNFYTWFWCCSSLSRRRSLERWYSWGMPTKKSWLEVTSVRTLWHSSQVAGNRRKKVKQRWEREYIPWNVSGNLFL